MGREVGRDVLRPISRATPVPGPMPSRANPNRLCRKHLPGRLQRWKHPGCPASGNYRVPCRRHRRRRSRTAAGTQVLAAASSTIADRLLDACTCKRSLAETGPVSSCGPTRERSHAEPRRTRSRRERRENDETHAGDRDPKSGDRPAVPREDLPGNRANGVAATTTGRPPPWTAGLEFCRESATEASAESPLPCGAGEGPGEGALYRSAKGRHPHGCPRKRS
jgi:hypothetical protein